jgi:hypothetical protein
MLDTLTLLTLSSLWEAKKINKSANFYAHHVIMWHIMPWQEFTWAAFPPFPIFFLLQLIVVV